MYYLMYTENSDNGDPVGQSWVKHFHDISNANRALAEATKPAIDSFYESNETDEDHFVETTANSVYIKDGCDAYSWVLHKVEFEDEPAQENNTPYVLLQHTSHGLYKLNGMPSFEQTIQLTNSFHQRLLDFKKNPAVNNDGMYLTFKFTDGAEIRIVPHEVVGSYVEALYRREDQRNWTTVKTQDRVTGTWDISTHGANYRIQILPPDNKFGGPGYFIQRAYSSETDGVKHFGKSIVLTPKFYQYLTNAALGRLDTNTDNALHLDIVFQNGNTLALLFYKDFDKDGHPVFTSEARIYDINNENCIYTRIRQRRMDLAGSTASKILFYLTGIWDININDTYYHLVVLSPDESLPKHELFENVETDEYRVINTNCDIKGDTRTYTKTVRLSNSCRNRINSYLTNEAVQPGDADDGIIIVFTNGFSMEITCSPCDFAGPVHSWTKAVLKDAAGSVMDCSDPDVVFEKQWRLTCGNCAYAVDIQRFDV